MEDAIVEVADVMDLVAVEAIIAMSVEKRDISLENVGEGMAVVDVIDLEIAVVIAVVDVEVREIDAVVREIDAVVPENDLEIETEAEADLMTEVNENVTNVIPGVHPTGQNRDLAREAVKLFKPSLKQET